MAKIPTFDLKDRFKAMSEKSDISTETITEVFDLSKKVVDEWIGGQRDEKAKEFVIYDNNARLKFRLRKAEEKVDAKTGKTVSIPTHYEIAATPAKRLYEVANEGVEWGESLSAEEVAKEVA